MPHTVTVQPGRKVSIDLYLQTSLPEGYFGLLRLRSGVARRLDLILHAGVIGAKRPRFIEPLLIHLFFIDEDFKGNLVLLLQNVSSEPLELTEGHAYAQFIPVRGFSGPCLGIQDFGFRVDRNADGFGSTEATARLNQLFADHLPPTAVTTPTREEDGEDAVALRTIA